MLISTYKLFGKMKNNETSNQRTMRKKHFDLVSFSNGGYVQIILAFSFLSCSSISQVNASIHQYQNESFIHRSNSFFFHGGSEGLYASTFHPLTSNSTDFADQPLDGMSFIRFESITFRRTKESAEQKNEMQQKTGLIEAIIVEVKDRTKIGGAFLNSDIICCTQKLANNGSCKVGEVIIKQDPDDPNGPRRIQTFFEGISEEAKMEPITIELNKTGMYYLYFMFCDPQLHDTLISGRTVWRNPDGYLPGKMAPMVTFFGFMSISYLILGLVWFLWFVRYWKDVMQLHYHITCVIGLGMCEMALWYFEYSNFNSSGSRPMGITISAVTFSSFKKTVSRLLLLVVSTGFGVVRPTLPGITTKVILLGATYFLASEALDLVEHLGNVNDFSGKTRFFMLLLLPVTVLDACFILWIFSSLSKTLEKLQVKKNIAKLELYRKFTNCLAVSVLLSITWIGYELYFNATDPLSELWQRAWIIPAFWTLLSFVLLVIICVLWAPSQNPVTRFAYSEDAGDDVDEDVVALTGTGIKVATDLSKLERKERKATSTTADHTVFGHGGDLEEDKRE